MDVATDTSNCETEPLRFPGAVQSHGAVLVLQPRTAMIEAASANTISKPRRLGHEVDRGRLDGTCAREGQHAGDQVEEALVLLRASVRPSIALSFENRLANTSASLLADPTQFMKIVMNLCINSSQAIENRGTIHIGLESAKLLDQAPPELRDGICLTVSDDGCGMTPEVLERLFDPFFTTKAPGEGSGLGLSVVYGIVNAMGGVIKVDSSTKPVGGGTRFQLFFPISARFPGNSSQVAHGN
jgi:signal transduction histidine kinase